MRFDTKQHPFYCGLALHARTLDVCLLRQDGEVRLHRHMQARPDAVLQASAPSRDAMGIAVACLLTWYWRADLGAQAGRPCVRGHALSRPASPGGKTTHDTIASQNSAVLRRGGLLPPADVSPAALRAPRALRRRRTPWMRQRAAWLAPLHKTTRQSPRPELGQQSADQATRDGGAERCPAPAGPKRSAVDLALLGHDDPRRRDVERSRLTTAPPPQAPPLSRRRTVPGRGARLSWGRLSAIHASTRCPRGHDGLSACRLGQGTPAAAGQRAGPAGPQSGHAPLTWAFAAAAVLLLRAQPAGHQSRPTREHKHGSGPALTLWGQQRGRTVYDRFQRPTACALGPCLHSEGSGAQEPPASRDHHGRRRRVVLGQVGVEASGNAEEPRGPWARLLWPLLGPPLRRLSRGARRVAVTWAAPPPRLRRTGARHPCSHPLA
jgi:hypothetical protein